MRLPLFGLGVVKLTNDFDQIGAGPAQHLAICKAACHKRYMTHWRPSPTIRFKALGLHWRDLGKGRGLLAAEVLDDQGRVKGVRPLGGTVEFGETAAAAVVREFREELGVEVTPLGAPVYWENLYTHEGQPGHEVLALFDVALPEGAFADTNRIAFHEDSGTLCHAQWFDIDQLDKPGAPALYPDGLKAHLTGRR